MAVVVLLSRVPKGDETDGIERKRRLHDLDGSGVSRKKRRGRVHRQSLLATISGTKA
jgi:hypothetical protein